MNPTSGWLPELGVVEVATPCRARWDEMVGDAQVRHCLACKLNVYNLSELTADEARVLLNRTEERMCVRFFVRPDGMLLTRDCPRGLAAKLRRRLAAIAASIVALLGIFLQPRTDEPAPGDVQCTPVAAEPAVPRKEAPIVDLGWADRRRASVEIQRAGPFAQGRRQTIIGVIRGNTIQIVK